MDNISLTIAIPTYNRCGILKENINIIKKIFELYKNCGVALELLILDNGGNSLDGLGYKYIKNIHNVGGNGNILRILDYVETDYVWILGDDDYLDANKIKYIIDALKLKNPDWLIFSQNENDYSISDFNGVNEVLNSAVPIQDIIFTSTNIYKMSCLSRDLTNTYNALNVHMPHFMAFCAYGSIESVCRIKINPFSNIGVEVNLKNRWPPICLYVDSIFDFIYHKNSNIKLSYRIKFLRKVRRQWLTNKNLVWSILLVEHSNFFDKIFLFYRLIIVLLPIDGVFILTTLPLILISIFMRNFLNNLRNKIKNELL